jgi:UPF0755 protein
MLTMRRTVWVLLIAAVLGAGWIFQSLYLPYQQFPSEGVYVDVPHGASRRAIARLLADQGVVRSRWIFEGLSRWRSHQTLEAGEYFFNHAVTSFEVFDAIANGRVYVRQLVVPEGFSMFDIGELVEHEGFTTRADFLAAARNPDPIRDLAPSAPSLEGFLFPATYEFPRHVKGEQIAAAMVERFRREWAGISTQSGGASNIRMEQAVTLASLVERETPNADERPLVASVFTNRLRLHLPLQCDPTVVYALELAGQYDGTLHAASLPFDSPYNTYRHTGLPPGPIANPGDASLRAALDPIPSEYLYFVANTQGGHFFSKTLAEHNRNVALYRERLAAERGPVQSLKPDRETAVSPRPAKSR